MNHSITLKDIAQALNLSTSTISKALNDSHEIGEATKKKVMAYAAQHHYVANRMAKGLKQGKSRSIGVIVCSLDNTFAAQMLDGIDKATTNKSYQAIIMQSKESQQKEIDCMDLLYAGGIDGLLISPACETNDFNYLKGLQEAGLPVVLFDRLTDEIDAYKIGVDNFKGAYEATSHLISRGYKKIAHLNTQTNLSISTDRYNGFRQALSDHQIEFDSAYLRFCDYTDKQKLNTDLEAALTDFMAMLEPPDAIFTATDQITTRCVALMNKLGYKVPQQVAIIGFTNTDLADAMNPALSTIHQPAFEMGKMAAETLIKLIEKKNIDQEDKTTVRLQTEIQIRLSTTAKP